MDTLCSCTLFWIQEVIPFLFLIKKIIYVDFFFVFFRDVSQVLFGGKMMAASWETGPQIALRN